MEYNALGRSGLKVSIVGLGGNNFGRRCDEEQTAAVVHRAMDLGITLFDTADVYGERGRSEEYVGKALKGVRREAIIATKIAGEMGEGPLWRGGSRRYIYDAVTESLRRLGTDYIDLLQMHFPDPSTPIEETMRASMTLSVVALFATSAAPTTAPLKWWKHSGPPGQSTSALSYRPKTNTTSSIAALSRSSCRFAKDMGWGSFLISRWPVDF